jgi:cell division cycle 20, cofactor of APC complex
MVVCNGFQAPTPGKSASSPMGTNKSMKLNFGAKTPGNGKSKEKVGTADNPVAHVCVISRHAAACRSHYSLRKIWVTAAALTGANCVLLLQLDRFIPNRSGIDFEAANYNLTKENQTNGDEPTGSPDKDEYQRMLAASLKVGNDAGRILAFKHKAPAAPEGYDNNLKGLYSQNIGPAPCKKQTRHIPQTQERILDAPELMDDYYLNLLDWSCQNIVSSAVNMMFLRDDPGPTAGTGPNTLPVIWQGVHLCLWQL